MKHEFKNYGRKLRKIHFYHGGRDRQFWSGHYGAKMAGAYVKVKIPENFSKKKEMHVESKSKKNVKTF